MAARQNQDVDLLTRAAGPADRPALLSLFREAFREEPDPELFRWKFDENPLAAPSAVAELDGVLVGHYGGLGTRYAGGGTSRPGTAAVDVMTSPRARALGHRGLFTELGDCFARLQMERGVPFYFGFPHARHSAISARLLGTRPIERAGLLSIDVASAGARRGRVPLLRRLRRRLLHPREGPRVSPAHEPLSEALVARPGLRSERSRAVLDWRLSRPGTGYHVIELVDPRGRSRGYAVLRGLGDRVLALDLQLLDESDGSLVELVERVLERSARMAPRLEVRLPGGGLLARRLREELGFTDGESDTCYEVRLLAPGTAVEDALLDYRYLDHEIF